MIFYHNQMLNEVRARLGKSEHILVAQELAEYIESQGSKGVARNRLADRKRSFAALSQRDENEVVFLMERNFNVLYTHVKGSGPKVRKFIHAKHMRDG